MEHFGTDFDSILNSLHPQSSAERPMSETFTRLVSEFLTSTEITSVNEGFGIIEYTNSENTDVNTFKEHEVPNNDDKWDQPNGGAPVEDDSNPIPNHFANVKTPFEIDNDIQQQPAYNVIQQPVAEASPAAESEPISLVPLNPALYPSVDQMDDHMPAVQVEVVITSDQTLLHPKPKRVRRKKAVDKNSEEYKRLRKINNAAVQKTRNKQKSEIEKMQNELPILREENQQLNEENQQLREENQQLSEENQQLRADKMQLPIFRDD